MNSEGLTCRVCMRPGWKIATDSLPLVFSDCLPWIGPHATWFACGCGYIGKALDQDYESALAVGYGTYTPFHQGGGEEQAMTQDGSSFQSRSLQVLTWLLKENLIPSNGSLLDWLYAFAWGAWVLMRGGLGWVGQFTPPVWSSTRSL